MWSAGMISDQTYKQANALCHDQSYFRPSEQCDKILEQANEEIGNIDSYSIFTPACTAKFSILNHLLRKSNVSDWNFISTLTWVMKSKPYSLRVHCLNSGYTWFFWNVNDLIILSLLISILSSRMIEMLLTCNVFSIYLLNLIENVILNFTCCFKMIEIKLLKKLYHYFDHW